MSAGGDVSSYIQAFNDFKSYVKKINSEYSTKKQHYGYLINLNNYYAFKENLKTNNINSSFVKYYDKGKIKLSPEDTTDLMVKLNSGYKFIIINNSLHKKICRLKDQNTHQIEYIISPEQIILYAENGQEFHFKNNKDNKIDKLSLLNYIPIANKTNNFKNDANKIYMDIINYYKMEKEISDKLENERTQEEKFIGFLVDITWLNNWKKYSFYDKIKDEFLLKKKNDKDKIINIIKEELKNTTKGDPQLVRHFLTPVFMVAFFYVNQSRLVLQTFKSAAAIWKQDRWKPIASGAANLTMNISFVIFLPDAYKLDGVILSTVLAILLIEIPWESHVLFTVFFDKAQSREYWKFQSAFLAAALAFCAIAWCAARMVALDGFAGLCAKGAAAALASGCAVLVLFRHDVRALFDALRKRRNRT